MIGEVLQGFRLAAMLGESGRGETYLAVHQESGRRAMVKVLAAELSSNAPLLAVLFAQVRAASQVEHPGIAACYGSGVHRNGRAFLVLEELAGRTLADTLVDLGRVDDSESLADIGWQLATLLAAVHGAGLVHGALQPDSVFLTFPPERAGRSLVKLLDFGMARLPIAPRHDQDGRLLGAPLYMSPEAACGAGPIDHRADIYSLGCILFEISCGRPPFVRQSRDELAAAHANEAPPSVVSLEPQIPSAIAALIGRMLGKHPAARPQSMAEVASVLDGFHNGSTLASAAPVAPTLVVPAAPVAPARARQDPTALLPPTPPTFPPAQVSPRPTTWVGRAQQRTAILDPQARPWPPESPVDRGPSSRRRPPSAPIRRDQIRQGPRAAISAPVVILTAAIVIGVGAAILMTRGKGNRPPRAIEVRAPALVPRAPATSEGEPPLPPLAEPSVAQTPAASPDRGEKTKARPPDRVRPEQRPPARRW